VPELNNEFQLPQERIQATLLEHGTELSFHAASESAAPYEQIRLAREAVALASTAPLEQSSDSLQPEMATEFVLLKQMGANIYTLRQRELDSHLFNEAA